VLWGVYIGLSRLSDNSFFTHLATGRLILSEGSIPTSDPYTFSAEGTPWVVQSWLASVVYASMERLGGIDAVRLLVAVLTAALVVVIWSLTRPADGLVARFAIGSSAVAVGALSWSARPLLFGLLCLAGTLLVLERGVRPWVLVPVFWVWVNTHGSFPLGVLALGALALGRRLDGEHPTRELRCLLWAGVGTVVGVLNPLGMELLTFPLRLLGRHDQFRYIVEWQSPDFSGALARVFLLQLVLAIALLLRSPRWRAAVPLLVFTSLALLASRNIAVASIVMVPGMAIGARGLGSVRADQRGGLATAGAVGVLGLAVVITSTALREPGFDLEGYPVDAVAWAAGEGLLDEGRVMASDSTGNYLELVRGSDASVFADDRVDMLPRGVVEDVNSLIVRPTAAHPILDRWDPTVVIWERRSPLVSQLLDVGTWELRFTDDEWVVLTPRSAAP
jgi:hypothetical protein